MKTGWPVALVLLLAGTAMAGCINTEDGKGLVGDGPDEERLQILRFDALGDPLGLPDDLADPVYRVTGHAGAEPNMGITSSGSVFFTAFSDVVRSRDRGENWEVVHTHELGNSDPMMWVDTWTDHVYNAPMYPPLLCASIYHSEDDGDTWDPFPRPDCGRGVYDHQKLASGPPGPEAPPAAGLLHDSVLYVCYNALLYTNCAVSYDNGATWPHDGPASTRLDPCTGINGHPTVSDQGIVAFAQARGCDDPQLVYSLDSGLSWKVVRGPSGVGADMIDPEIAFTPDGTLYMLFRGEDQRTYVGRTTDMGATWGGPWAVSPPQLNATVFGALGAGDDGRIAMSFLGTDHPDVEKPSDAPADARWHLWMVGSDDADQEVPTFTAYQVTPDEDPVQIGCVWLGGGGNPCRNMLDFIDGAVHPDGTFYTAYTEGCADGCAFEPDATNETSRSRIVGLARLDGFSLYADAAMPMDAAPPSRPLL